MKKHIKTALPDFILLASLVYITTLNATSGIVMVVALFISSLIAESEKNGCKNLQWNIYRKWWKMSMP